MVCVRVKQGDGERDRHKQKTWRSVERGKVPMLIRDWEAQNVESPLDCQIQILSTQTHLSESIK